jgi:hypothetical protein
MSMSKKLADKKIQAPKAAPRSEAPLWRGPLKDGITFSLLSRFLVCRERFRLLVVRGLKPASQFNHRLEYGTFWHLCEEMHAQGMEWEGPLDLHCQQLCQQHPSAVEQIRHWRNVCAVQFPIYLDYWLDTGGGPPGTGMSGKEGSRPILWETAFSVPYPLPSGRVVRLRGCWDAILAKGKGSGGGLYVQDNKTKGDVDEQQIVRQLSFDLQTMLYVVALEQVLNTTGDDDKVTEGRLEGLRRWCARVKQEQRKVVGVSYNVVRRPLSGGKGSIVRHKPSKQKPEGESEKEFYIRLGEVIKENADTFFMRWDVQINARDILRFRTQCLDPVLEQLCDWWEWVQYSPDDPFKPNPGPDGEEDENMRLGLPYGLHWRHPFGVYNVLDEGGHHELDEYLESGSEAGLERCTTLFPELDRRP